MNNPRVSIIILNWNSSEDTIECLESICQITYDKYDIIIIDNGSNDESISNIKEFISAKLINNSVQNISLKKFNRFIELDYNELNKFNKGDFNIFDSKNLILIKNKKNYGFTKGNNIGMTFSLKNLNPKYILLLNNDTIVKKDFLNILIESGEKNKKTGFLGPKIYFYEKSSKKNIIQSAGAFQNLWFYNPKIRGIFEVDNGQYNTITKIDFVQGACILVKIQLIKQIGLLDENFFSYREENDWGLRADKKNWDSFYIPNSVIWHKGGKSSGGHLSPISIFYTTRNDFLLIKKHGNIIQILIFSLYFIFFKLPFWALIYLIYHKNLNAFVYLIKGVKAGIKWKTKD